MKEQLMLERLRANREVLASRFDVCWMGVFGSVSRDEARPESDVDILVSFQGPATFDGYFGLKFFLEELLEREVDLVTDKALRSELRERVEKDLVRVA